MVGLLRRTPHAGSMAGWAMTRYERFVHAISIGRQQRAAKQRALKSLSGIARCVSESADTRGGRSAGAVLSAVIRRVRSDE
ncbi:TPA: hypothetical protein QDC03_001098 [Burkholderia cepacia]|uniref:hypothetical protein n=1 Tax=Burkholderia cepacia complex TaxID=87882 RepID=UPI0011B1F541|nr:MULTISPECIES: hypothetical protein [Burkholderia cepacia complex]HDR9506054.1 hypothetical protein [Burkholderia cepacia]